MSRFLGLCQDLLILGDQVKIIYEFAMVEERKKILSIFPCFLELS